jgi:hypothetical protein
MFLNLKIFRFETTRIFIIIHFRKTKKKRKKKKEKGKIPVAGPFPWRPMRGGCAGALIWGGPIFSVSLR